MIEERKGCDAGLGLGLGLGKQPLHKEEGKSMIKIMVEALQNVRKNTNTDIYITSEQNLNCS